MKIKELIEKLGKFNKEFEVCVLFRFEGVYANEIRDVVGQDGSPFEENSGMVYIDIGRID